MLFLENVKNLVAHDHGDTLKTIKNTLKELNYNVFFYVLNACNFGLSQNRERIYIVAFHNKINSTNFKFPTPTNQQVCLADILEKNSINGKVIERNDIEIYKNYTLPFSFFGEMQLLNKPIQIGIVNKGGQGERIYHPLGQAITLSA